MNSQHWRACKYLLSLVTWEDVGKGQSSPAEPNWKMNVGKKQIVSIQDFWKITLLNHHSETLEGFLEKPVKREFTCRYRFELLEIMVCLSNYFESLFCNFIYYMISNLQYFLQLQGNVLRHFWTQTVAFN